MTLGRPPKRLYTEDHFENKMPEVTKPEIERSPLAHVIMQLLAARVKNIRKFEFLDRPPEDAIKTALNELKILGVSRDIGQNEMELTDLGLKIGSDTADSFINLFYLKKILWHTFWKVRDRLTDKWKKRSEVLLKQQL